MQIKVEGRTVASIIPTLVSGLYFDRFDLVREYCQNSYDAILLKYRGRAKNDGRIKIKIDGDSLHIHDNGTGMTNIRQRLNLLYGERYGFKAEYKDKDAFEVILSIPLEKTEHYGKD